MVSDETSDVRFCRQDVVMNAGEVGTCFSCCVNFSLNSTVTRNTQMKGTVALIVVRGVRRVWILLTME